MLKLVQYNWFVKGSGYFLNIYNTNIFKRILNKKTRNSCQSYYRYKKDRIGILILSLFSCVNQGTLFQLSKL